MLSAALMLLAALPAEAHGAYPAPPGGGDHACMAYASFRALSEEERAWLYPEIDRLKFKISPGGVRVIPTRAPLP